MHIGYDKQCMCCLTPADLHFFTHRMVFEELLLIFVLILDVLVDLTVFLLLIFDECKETLVHGNFELLVVVSVLNNLIDRVFEVVDDRVIVPLDNSILLDEVLDEALAHSQVFYHETKTSIHRVVLLKLLVHRACSLSQALDLELFRRNVLSQVSNLLIEHKLELFQFLGLLLQVKYILFPLMNCVVLDVNLCLLLSPFEVQLLNDLLLLVQRDVPIQDLAIKSLDLGLHISQLVLPNLKVSLRPAMFLR